MASEWAEEADQQARAMTRDLVECGKRKGFRVTYQKREARFALRAGTNTTYFSAHDYKHERTLDWLKLRIDVLAAAQASRGASGGGDDEQLEHAPTPDETTSLDAILRRFEEPDEVREFEKGRLELIHVGGMTIGRARYEPGWKWSEHVRPLAGTRFCEVEHVGMVLSGTATAAMVGGETVELTAGSVFYVPAAAHDSWVVGDEPYVSLHFLGAAHYAK